MHHNLPRFFAKLVEMRRSTKTSKRTMWSVSNAFTSAFQELDLIPQFKATAKLGSYLERVLGLIGLLERLYGDSKYCLSAASACAAHFSVSAERSRLPWILWCAVRRSRPKRFFRTQIPMARQRRDGMVLETSLSLLRRNAHPH
jgi:hypothetical protein